MRLISLGSSFAAGPGIPPQVDKDAGRSLNNYPSFFARRLDLDPHDAAQFLDLTVSGATLLNLISQPQTAGNTVYPPQLDSLPDLAPGDQGSDLVITITGGGNDLFYIGSMFAYTLKHTLWGRFVTRFLMSNEQKESLSHPTIATPQEVLERFSLLLDSITQKYPKATVYLVEYFAVMGPDTVAARDVGWDQQQIDSYIEIADLLQDLYAKAAKPRPNVHIVPLAQESKREHALGSKNPWVSDGSFCKFYAGGAYHPNEKGMRAAADRLFDLHSTLHSSKERR
ncbi:uncharacterized protein SRS1_13411 [Sporisorium reilianum f. sp. reilianum]|uniref:SGNH hydrolase-type esterase domain-containing protein n=1 Tax=Sporisorium reilianum f. sp. reilianum TaxID=72559 RepID=A0A2N8UC88_9BASI|nr:uncharacterized protein SRS1_13411 [Sporisorium reilianum f. sp. reilianum]